MPATMSAGLPVAIPIDLLSPRLFSVEEFERMIEAEIFEEDEHAELIEGRVVSMSPIGSPHIGCVLALTSELSKLKPDDLQVLVQCAVVISASTRPQPDVCLLRARPDGYWDGLARPEDITLLIEVSDSSLRYARQVKLPLYARAGVPEVWIANLKAKQLEVYRDPNGERYKQVLTLDRTQSVTPTKVPEITLPVASVIR